MKPKILFVDDEQNILDSLRLSLRPMRPRWDMSFTLGGQAALELLDRAPHEVVVSDMRMPGIDGAQLLREVQQRYPESVRIILSGYCAEESALKAVKQAHQYLSKPCRPVELIEAVENALSLRGVLTCGRIKTTVSRLGTLPALPEVYKDLVSALQDENVILKDLADIVGRDVAMSATILRLVNSAFFGRSNRISSLHHAVSLLGGQTLRVLVLSTHLFESLQPQAADSFSVRRLWDHSLRVARFVRVLAEAEGAGQEEREDGFVAGMLHDIGKLVLLTNMGEEYREVVSRARAGDVCVHDAELEVFGASHAQVGAYLMSLWGFKKPAVEAVCWHHCPERQSPDAFSPALALYAADALDHELVCRDDCRPVRPARLPGDDAPRARERLDAWRGLCSKALNEEVCDA